MSRTTVLAALVLVAVISGATGATGATLITGKQIKNHSIHAIDLASDARGLNGTDGVDGVDGIDGQPGPQGPPGVANFRTVSGPGSVYCANGGACTVVGDTVACPLGTVVTGGGYDGGTIQSSVTYNRPNGNGWGVVFVNNSSNTGTIRAYAVCAATSGAAAARQDTRLYRAALEAARHD